MKITYRGLDGEMYSEILTAIQASDILLHSTPDENVEKIVAEGLRTNMPRTKLMVDVDAIFCTIPSASPNTKDLFRYYDDWSIIVIDTKMIPNHKWYIDFLAAGDRSNNGSNRHILTFENIPRKAIKKVIK